MTMFRSVRAATALVAVICTVTTSLLAVTSARAATVPLSVKVVGKHFVNGAGRTIRLLGVNHTSAEYACVDGFGYDDGHFDDADARAIAAWGANAVRVPLNEDCWLGINGQPNSDQGADPALTRTGYQAEIKRYVADLNRHGLYAILDLHWTAPGAQVALEQQPMPDHDYSPAFWSSVASTFKTNKAVVFDLFNEPYDPTDPKSGDDPDPNDKVTWNCWQTGTHDGPAGGTACFTSAYDQNGARTTTYQIAGLQTLLDAVRATGARQPVIAGGLDYANDLGVGDHGGGGGDHPPPPPPPPPDDPLNQEAAGFHNYMGKACDTATCWKGTLAPIATHVPVVTGEFDEDNYLQRKCGTKKASTFDAGYMKWADSVGVSYLAWGWIVESQAEQDADGCSAFFLITNYTKYTPAAPNGTALYRHLRALATPPPVTLSAFAASVRKGNTTVAFTLRSPSNARATISGKTVFAHVTTKGGKAHQVTMGKPVSLTLVARRSATGVMTLYRAFRSILLTSASARVTITIVLTSPDHRRTVLHRTITVKRAK